MDYGFSGLFKSQNGGTPNASSNDLSIQALSAVANLITIDRVTDIILDDTHPDFVTAGGWRSIGFIKTAKSNKFIAPLNINVKSYPLKNEVVVIMNKATLFSIPNIVNTTDIPVLDTTDSYYLNVLGIWGSHHHNAYPFAGTEEEQIEAYVQSSLKARFNPVRNDPTEASLGKTFVEKEPYPPALLPFEGDILVEGRWGNSIRLGSTTKYNDTPEGIYYKSIISEPLNPWSSTTSQNGDPIILIKNSRASIKYESYSPTNVEEVEAPTDNPPIIENINNDDSSIYLTSSQRIPIARSNVSYNSYNGTPFPTPPISPNEFDLPQIVLNSNRLLFNASGDHILLSSANSINLNADKSVNVDTQVLSVHSEKIFLGPPSLATQPLMLGDNTVDLLRQLVSSVKQLSEALKNLKSDNVAQGFPATFTDLIQPMNSISTQMDALLSNLGTTPENCILTSKNNFTV